MLKLKKYYLFLLSIILLSCQKDIEPSWEVSVLTPILKTTLDINDILTDSLLQANADTTLKIVYEYPLFDESMDSLVGIPDTILSKAFPWPFAGSLMAFPHFQLFDSIYDKQFELGNAKITRIDFLSGFVELEVTNTLKEVVEFTYELPTVTFNNIPFSETFDMPPATNTIQGVYHQTYDISGYSFDLTGIDGNSVNTLVSHAIAKLTDTVNGDWITPNDSTVINIRLIDLVIGYAKGYFGSDNISVGPETTDFNIFNKFTNGTLELENVNLSLALTNNVGIDARMFINNLTSINSRTGKSVDLASSYIGKAINITRANETYISSDPVNGSDYIIPLNNTNSNIKQLIENLPNQFSYSMNVLVNPLGNVSCGNDFIYHNNGIKASLNVDIPLSLIANNLTLVDTIDFQIEKSEDLYNVTDKRFTIIADNGFPFTANIQLYFIDSITNLITDSLFATNIIGAAPLDANNRVITKKRSILSIPMSDAKMDKLYGTKKMLIMTRFNTTGVGEYVKIYSNYNIDLKLTGNFNFIIKQ